MKIAPAFHPPKRLMMGPGPGQVAPAVLQAMAQPIIGIMDPAFLRLMEESQAMLRAVFLTKNELTFPVSGTGSAGMEFCLANLVEPGDEVVVGINGSFGLRMADMAERCGARVSRVEAEWGRIIEPEQMAAALKNKRPKLVALAHGETSTGVLTPTEEIGRLAREAGALFMLDTVVTLGGCPVRVDQWGVDAAFSASQKCLGCPPGLAPVSLSARAVAAMGQRRRPSQSWYLDGNLLAGYWGPGHGYHHTTPINMNYGLHEALRLALQEGLAKRWRRHEQNFLALKRGLTGLGLETAGQPEHPLWPLTAVRAPAGVDAGAVRTKLLTDFNIEVGEGFGPWRGKVWRVGLMGDSSRGEYVEAFLAAMKELLR